MRTRFRSEDDGWHADGCRITSPETLDRIRSCLEIEGPVILEHRFYRGASAPDRLVFADMDELLEYLEARAFAGDSISVWSLMAVCRDDNMLADGKCPDENGLVPKRGAY
jgi:hypothetical protein